MVCLVCATQVYSNRRAELAPYIYMARLGSEVFGVELVLGSGLAFSEDFCLGNLDLVFFSSPKLAFLNSILNAVQRIRVKTTSGWCGLYHSSGTSCIKLNGGRKCYRQTLKYWMWLGWRSGVNSYPDVKFYATHPRNSRHPRVLVVILSSYTQQGMQVEH